MNSKETAKYEEAVDMFNNDMSSSCNDDDRKHATVKLGLRIGSIAKAETLRRDWMLQFNETQRELRTLYA